jgi:hypothetical protein
MLRAATRGNARPERPLRGGGAFPRTVPRALARISSSLRARTRRRARRMTLGLGINTPRVQRVARQRYYYPFSLFVSLSFSSVSPFF